MSRIAIHYWQQRIAPVFDVGGNILVMDSVAGSREQYRMSLILPALRADELRALNVETIICGAISRPMRDALLECGIRVVGFVSGDVEGVLAAWEQGTLDDAFAMPGCRGRGCVGNQHARRRCLCQEETEQVRVEPDRRQGAGLGCVRTRSRHRDSTIREWDKVVAGDSADK